MPRYFHGRRPVQRIKELGTRPIQIQDDPPAVAAPGAGRAGFITVIINLALTDRVLINHNSWSSLETLRPSAHGNWVLFKPTMQVEDPSLVFTTLSSPTVYNVHSNVYRIPPGYLILINTTKKPLDPFLVCGYIRLTDGAYF